MTGLEEKAPEESEGHDLLKQNVNWNGVGFNQPDTTTMCPRSGLINNQSQHLHFLYKTRVTQTVVDEDSLQLQLWLEKHQTLINVSQLIEYKKEE
jgi:hypothetical protein